MIRPRSRVLLAVLALLALLVPLAPPATAAGSVTATYSLVGEWDGNFQAAYTVTNGTPATISSWRVEFDLAAGTNLTSSWDAVVTRTGNRVVAANASWNAPLAAGQTATFGFIARGPARPANCRVNGGLCEGGAGDTSAPTAPGNLRVTGTSTSTVSLAWNASTDNIGVVAYDVYSGSTQLITTDATTGTVGGLTPGTTYTFTVRARDAAGNSSPAGNAVTATTVSGPAGSLLPVAPYVDMGAWPTPSLTAMASAGNLRSFTLGFITGSGGCKASWFGAYDPRTAWGKDQIDAIRARGGDVKISFGGAAGSELAQVCPSAEATAAEYQAVVDAYQLRYLDLDIEGGAVADPVSIARRSQALSILQRNRPALKISLTLPVLPEGLDANGFAVLKSARDHGIALDVVNIMAMDYNRAAGNYGDFAVQAAQSTFGQIKSLWPALTDAQAWLKIGVTPMLGRNDDGGTFSQAHSAQLVNFARGKHLGMLSFWEMTRDRDACNGTLVNCTNVPQAPYEFSKIFAGYTG
ncbi:hypothetical protein HPO96_09380 [Kribbella sandramycini]|uniref:Glycosyl hydrolase family 18 (Putative chitinase) n=1 Tax=Kribbella sandramycini TaxID=60450 RepID=A0A7Y4KXG5_9ACTN|nr:cellulose binding domain-containing protein [Kribbella sandramycini]MBB6569715.1 hypothetical protein [Kribbella sandramycini]NOL40455.1 hypothetical protein [Kribbella sandramycini]